MLAKIKFQLQMRIEKMIDLEAIVQQAAKGDEVAWQSLVKPHNGMPVNIGRRFRLTTEKTQDVIQDTWLQLLRHINDLPDPARIGGCWRRR